MSGHTSATGGPLAQTNPIALDTDLENALHDLITYVLGLTGDLVRPRWQMRPPNQPAIGVTWASFGITRRERFDYPQITHFNGGPDRLTRWTMVHVLVSVYGPNASANAEALRDAMYIGQNNEGLASVGLKITDAGEVTMLPDLINTQFVNRADLPLRFAQAVNRDYNVLDIASSEGPITTVDGVTAEWNVTQ